MHFSKRAAEIRVTVELTVASFVSRAINTGAFGPLELRRLARLGIMPGTATALWMSAPPSGEPDYRDPTFIP